MKQAYIDNKEYYDRLIMRSDDEFGAMSLIMMKVAEQIDSLNKITGKRYFCNAGFTEGYFYLFGWSGEDYKGYSIITMDYLRIFSSSLTGFSAIIRGMLVMAVAPEHKANTYNFKSPVKLTQ